MVGAELRACQESLDAEKGRVASLDEQVAVLTSDNRAKSEAIAQLQVGLRDVSDESAGRLRELGRMQSAQSSSQHETSAKDAELNRLRQEVDSLQSQLMAKTEALDVQKHSIEAIRKSAEEVASFEAEEISRLEAENRLLRERGGFRLATPLITSPLPPTPAPLVPVPPAGDPTHGHLSSYLPAFPPADPAPATVVRELSERCNWLQQQNTQLGSTLAVVARCQTQTANALLEQRGPSSNQASANSLSNAPTRREGGLADGLAAWTAPFGSAETFASDVGASVAGEVGGSSAGGGRAHSAALPRSDSPEAWPQAWPPQPAPNSHNQQSQSLSSTVLAQSPGPAQELERLQLLLGGGGAASAAGSAHSSTRTSTAQQPNGGLAAGPFGGVGGSFQVVQPSSAGAAGTMSLGSRQVSPTAPPLRPQTQQSQPQPQTNAPGAEKELHQLHSLLSQTYRVGTSAQDPAVDECIRLSLKLADDILSETTGTEQAAGATSGGQVLPAPSTSHYAPGFDPGASQRGASPSPSPVGGGQPYAPSQPHQHHAGHAGRGDEARLLDSLFNLYSSSASERAERQSWAVGAQHAALP